MPNSTRVPLRESLGDEAAHRVANNVDLTHSDVVEHTGEVIGIVVDLEAEVGRRGETVAAVVDHDHSPVHRQLGSNLIPLGQGCPSEPVYQEDGYAFDRSHLANEKLGIADEHRAARDTQGMLLWRLEIGLEPRAERSPHDDATQHPLPELHCFRLPTAKDRSSTGSPPMRCSSMIRSSFSMSRLAYQVPSG